MKTLNEYINSSFDNEELIDEGLKDWLKTATVSASLASALISPQIAKADIVKAKPGQQTEFANQAKEEYLDDYGEDCDVFMSTEYEQSNLGQAKQNAEQELMKELKANNQNDNVIKQYRAYELSNGKICFAFILKPGSIKK